MGGRRQKADVLELDVEDKVRNGIVFLQPTTWASLIVGK